MKHTNEDQNTNHHERTPRVQKSFTADLRKLVTVIDDWGNPFMDDSAELFAIDTKVMVSEEGIRQIRTSEAVGNVQYATFIEERVKGSRKSVYDPVKKNNSSPFKMQKKKLNSPKSKLSNLKDDVKLFSRMMIVSQQREGNLEGFFSHENHPWP